MTALFAPILAWLFSTATLRFVSLAVITALVAALVSLLVSFLPAYLDGTALTALLAQIPPGLWYFLDLFQFSQGFSLLIGAYVARFLIRRIPVIG